MSEDTYDEFKELVIERKWDKTTAKEYVECLINLLKKQGREILEDTITVIPIYQGTGEEDDASCFVVKYTIQVFVKKVDGEQEREIFIRKIEEYEEINEEQKHEEIVEECRNISTSAIVTFIPRKTLTQVILEEY